MKNSFVSEIGKKKNDPETSSIKNRGNAPWEQQYIDSLMIST